MKTLLISEYCNRKQTTIAQQRQQSTQHTYSLCERECVSLQKFTFIHLIYDMLNTMLDTSLFYVEIDRQNGWERCLVQEQMENGIIIFVKISS